MSGPSRWSMTTLPVGRLGRPPERTIVHRRQSLAAAAAVIRTWLLWRPPPVTSVSLPLFSASAQRYASLRALLPPPASPVQSSRLTHSAPSAIPRAAPMRSAGSSGVGTWARGNGVGIMCRRTVAPPSSVRPERPEATEERDGRDLLVGQQRPVEHWRPAAADDLDHPVRSGDQVDPQVVRGDGNRPRRPQLQLVNGGDDAGGRPDQPGPGCN